MHSYGSDFKYGPIVHLVLAALSVGAYALVRQLDLPFAISPLIVLTIFGALEFLFDKAAWRILACVPFTGLVCVSGDYKGHLKTEAGEEHSAILTVKQNWTRMVVEFQSGPATARSISASITHSRQKNGEIELVYNYFAQHGRDEGGMRFNHYGTAILILSKIDQGLSGEYYTEQKRNSAGALFLKRC